MKYSIAILCRAWVIALLSISALDVSAQNIPGVQPYGKVDKADLELKQCDFEPDANAEVLFDYAVQDHGAGMPISRHTRIKIFNEFGKGYGNIDLEYLDYAGGVIGISDLKAETINEEDGKVAITPLDKKDILKVTIDKWHSALRFAMPALKPGSVIEFSYREFTPGVWNFQNFLPVRYSEIELDILGNPDFKSVPYVQQPFVKSKGETTDTHIVRAMANIHSMPGEPYISSRVASLQRIEFFGVDSRLNTWNKIARIIAKADVLGYDLNSRLDDESEILNKVKDLKTDDEKITYIFDQVKTRVKWNDKLSFLSDDGIKTAWKKKTGNSTDVNMIVYHLLRSAGIKAIPVLVCPKNRGKINPANPNVDLFYTAVIYVPVDSTRNYILDATSKYSLPASAPENLLNSFGLGIDLDNALSVSVSNNGKSAQTVFIANDEPAVQSILLSGEIKPQGKLEGEVEITSSSYDKIKALKLYDSISQEKYLDLLKNHDNDLKISSFERENVEQDSLPLKEKFNFSWGLSGSDENYIYLKTNILNGLGKNPFYSETRFSDIDLGYFDNHAFVGSFKLPSGYKIDALPKSIALVMPDQSIIFKRTIVAQEGESIMIRYVLIHKKTIYFKENYDDLRTFYQKMYELMNDQVVLKKS